ncbi:Tn3 family transposase [Frankia sp. AiPa1]|uniref:Tn3 family transposase n=1 Tax=Frankia sp. AiPa1 TaxID=573492 RepID=UPI0027E3C657|nr:Tn3 family transposase [Frankia sp. AiPa1]
MDGEHAQDDADAANHLAPTGDHLIQLLDVLQAAVAFVNTLLVQDVLAEPTWAGTLTAPDRRGLTPLFWTHVAPYGEVRLNMAKRLELRGDAHAAVR